jgi:hypothetical protein
MQNVNKNILKVYENFHTRSDYVKILQTKNGPTKFSLAKNNLNMICKDFFGRNSKNLL